MQLMAETTPYQQLRQLDFTIKRLSISNGPDITTAAWRSFEHLKRDMRSALDRMHDYEASALEEDLRMQAKTLPAAIKALEKLRGSLLKASEYDLVSAIQIAQISAELDQLIDRLR